MLTEGEMSEMLWQTVKEGIERLREVDLLEGNIIGSWKTRQ